MVLLYRAVRAKIPYDTCDRGPALSGKLLVLSTWMPACCSPLNGVTIGLDAPGSHPRLNGTLGSLNQRPRWYWWVGAKLTVGLFAGETENVSLLKMPCTVTLPLPYASVWRSV